MTVKCMLKDSIDCPVCGCVSNLNINSWSGFSTSPKISFFYKSLAYSCECGEHFTTTESDSISMCWYDIEKRREIRKYKINKFNEYFW